MALHNLAKEYTATLGTANVVLTGAVDGFNTFPDAGVINGETVNYGIVTYDLVTHRPVDSEVGQGVWTLGTLTLSRDNVVDSTNGGAKITLTGLSQVFLPALAEDIGGGESKSAVMWHDQSIIIAGNAFAYASDALQKVTYQNVPANADEFKNGFACLSGTYSLNFLGQIGTAGGKLDVYVDNVLVGTLDFYNGILVNNTTLTIAGLSFSSGYHTLRCVVNGKNGASIGYSIVLAKIYIKPSAY